MTKKARIIASFASIAAIGMALAGCGGSTATNEAKSEKSGEPVEITYMHRLPDSDGMVKVDEIVAKWNKEHPDIQVKATKFDGKSSDMIKKLETDIKAGKAPDLAQIGYAELPEVYTKNMLEDVTEEAAKYQDHYAAGAFSLMKVGDKTFGLPQDTGPLVYYYNAAEFEKLGIGVPESKDDLIAAAKKAAEQGKYILDYEADEVGYMFSGLSGASTPWYKVEDDKWVVNTETDGSKEVADVYQQLLDAKAIATHPRWDPSFDAALQDGSLIGTIGAGWEAPLIMGSAGDAVAGQWKVALIGDWFGNAGKTGPDGGSGVAVLKGSKHAAEAMEFNDWFNTQVADLTSQGLIVAANTEAAKTPEAWSKFYSGQDVMAELTKANAAMGDFTYMPGFSAVTAAMAETAAKATDGSGKVADIFSTAQSTSLDTLKNLGLPVAE